jgi:hypothetical protein
MDSLLPVAQAPILRMSGGGMSLLPDAPPVPIAGMHGGASLLPDAPPVPIAGMHGGADLYPVPLGTIHNSRVGSDHVASFGIVNSFSANESALPKTAPCAPITETPTALCDILYPFVDRRVQALLKRVGFPPSGNQSIDMGCGTITREGTKLTISFHEKAITLLSGDLTGTFAAFHKGMPPHQPSPVKDSKSDKGAHGLLSWMLGSPVTDTGVFNLITFMDLMQGSHTLSVEGFRTFLSYHKDNVKEADVLRYAMELYGYKTGDATNTKDVYGLMLPPHTAVRRTGATFAVYVDGKVTSDVAWNPTWEHSEGFAVYEPTVALSASVALAPSSPVPADPTMSFSGKKISTPVEVSDQQTIGGHSYALRGMIQHAGDTGGGHYTYLYHSPTETKWVQFSDSNMTYPPVEDIKKELHTGYIYLFEKKAHDSGVHKGIQNHGNSCWMNAALQMFYHLPEYRAYVEGFRADTSTPSQEINITLAIQQIFLKYSGGDQVIACSAEYQTLFKYTFPDQPVGSQQDAMEFITKVLLGIVENVPRVKDLFAIEYVSTLTCSETTITPSIKKDQMNVLSLVIPSTSSPLTLDTLLTTESTPEIMGSGTKVGDTSCSTVTKTVTIQIPDANQYAMIQLKRFT